jgi:hypothetical protein
MTEMRCFTNTYLDLRRYNIYIYIYIHEFVWLFNTLLILLHIRYYVILTIKSSIISLIILRAGYTILSTFFCHISDLLKHIMS